MSARRVASDGLFGAILSVFVCAASGCSGFNLGGLGGGGSIDPNDVTPIEQFTQKALDRFCDVLSGCCSAANDPFDSARCQTFNRSWIPPPPM